MKVLVPLGTRPEAIKLAPVVRALRGKGLEVRVVATGQHSDPSLTDVFFEALHLQPDARWRLEGGEGERVGQMLALAYAEIAGYRPDLVLLLGDTHTVPLFCLAARNHRVPIAHLEAGMRSFNETSMEEVNRRVAAATASLHLAPTELAARFLAVEGVSPKRIRVVGNPVIDALREMGVAPRPVAERKGVVVTVHRRTTVDDPCRLGAVVDLVCRLAGELPPLTFPVHPRTRLRLEEAAAIARLESCGVELLPPVPYGEMLTLLAGAAVVVTDSGGLQEEASWLGVPVVVLRRSTPRWEGVEAGTSVLVGLDAGAALEAARRLSSPEEAARVAAVPCPYGDGATAARVADLLCEARTASLLVLTEPDFVNKGVPR